MKSEVLNCNNNKNQLNSFLSKKLKVKKSLKQKPTKMFASKVSDYDNFFKRPAKPSNAEQFFRDSLDNG